MAEAVPGHTGPMVRVPFRAAADRVRHRISQLTGPKSRGRDTAGARP
ncbi:hypothetical protein GA0115261_107311, partial [Streptomyces sp. OspMP-M43]